MVVTGHRLEIRAKVKPRRKVICMWNNEAPRRLLQKNICPPCSRQKDKQLLNCISGHYVQFRAESSLLEPMEIEDEFKRCKPKYIGC